MATYTQVATILQRSLGQEEGLLVLEYIESRIPPDVTRQSDLSKTETALRLEIEKVRAEVEKVRADLSIEIERSRAVQTRWAFLFWLSQMAVLVGILFRILP